MDRGDIYVITSPSGTQYVGQCVKYLSNGRIWGFKSRFKAHLRDAHDPLKDYCVLLNKAIRKYGHKSMQHVLIKECSISELDYWESYYIEKFNTLSPNGYNLIIGGSNSRQSEQTKLKRKESMMGKNLGKRYSKRIRKNFQDNTLPKYIRCYRDKSGKTGYRVQSHPTLKSRSFVSKYETMEIKLEKAMDYLNDADIE